MAFRPRPLAWPAGVLEMQHLKAYPRATVSEIAFSQDTQVTGIHINIWEALFPNFKIFPSLINLHINILCPHSHDLLQEHQYFSHRL